MNEAQRQWFVNPAEASEAAARIERELRAILAVTWTCGPHVEVRAELTESEQQWLREREAFLAGKQVTS